MSKKPLYFLCLILLAAIPALAATPDTTFKVLQDTASLNARIRAYSENLQTIESNFTQLKYMSVLTEPSKSTGYFCYKNPGRVRWEYLEPFTYLVVINNNRFEMKDGGKTTSYNMASTKAFVAMSAGFGELLKGNIFNKTSDFSCQYYENGLTYKLILVPNAKALKKYFNSIVLYFDKKLFSVSRVVMIEWKGDRTDIEFTGRKINEGLADDMFIIK